MINNSPLLYYSPLKFNRHSYKKNIEPLDNINFSSLEILEFPVFEIDDTTVLKITSYPQLHYKSTATNIFSDISSKKFFDSEKYLSTSDKGPFSQIKSFVKSKKILSSVSIEKGLIFDYEESIINKRFTAHKTIYGYNVLLSASGGFYSKQLSIPLELTFFEQDYFTKLIHTHGFINLSKTSQISSKKGYRIPFVGCIQLVYLLHSFLDDLFLWIFTNPDGSIIKIFNIPYNFHDIPNKMATFIR